MATYKNKVKKRISPISLDQKINYKDINLLKTFVFTSKTLFRRTAAREPSSLAPRPFRVSRLFQPRRQALERQLHRCLSRLQHLDEAIFPVG